MTEVNICRFCGEAMSDERPFDYCLAPDCYKQGFERTPFVVVGQHKGPPLVLSPRDSCITNKENTMRRS